MDANPTFRFLTVIILIFILGLEIWRFAEEVNKQDAKKRDSKSERYSKLPIDNILFKQTNFSIKNNITTIENSQSRNIDLAITTYSLSDEKPKKQFVLYPHQTKKFILNPPDSLQQYIWNLSENTCKSISTNNKIIKV